PNLIDAARAVVAADRAGELTDEHIQALEAAANAEAAPPSAPVTEECQKAIRRVYVSLNSPIVAGRIYAKYNRKVIEAALEVLVQVHDQLAGKETPK
ncbi:hypothetical protein, partial [Chromobacterium sp.]|uniref:hypothetical protein n=1 Tax=Chromobacterium sp. TaxID=306190 RepID=UPI0035B13712